MIAWLVFILFIWFETDAFVWWFKWVKAFKIEDYLEYKEEMDVSYPEWLYIKTPNFWTKLISCPPCILVWMCLPLGISALPVNYLCSYVVYRLIKKLN